jgi:phospholipid/cholesterol/gamma-HCH transport system substrate-binding protein
MARRGSLSILERNQRVIGLVALILIISGTAFALLLQGGFLTPTYTVTAKFSDAAGIRSGDLVTVAGLQAGTVDEVRIEDGQVAMDLAVKRSVELPADVSAEVAIETLLGRKSVALVPGEAGGRLADGDVIPIERTVTPIDITELNDISVELLDGSDAEAFEGFLRELAAITKGKARDVRRLVEGLGRVTAAVDARREQLAGLIESLRVLSTTLGQRDQTIVSLIDNFDVVLGNLAQRQDDLERLLHNTDLASHETADLVRRNREELDSMLRSLHTDLQVFDQHQLDLAAGIAYLNQAVEGYSSVGYSAGGTFRNHWANIFVQSLGPVGVDALVGKCGVVDQLFDHYFGADCAEAGSQGPEGTAGGGEQGGPGAAPVDPAPPAAAAEPQGTPAALPCSIDDVLGGVLAGDGPASGGCQG